MVTGGSYKTLFKLKTKILIFPSNNARCQNYKLVEAYADCCTREMFLLPLPAFPRLVGITTSNHTDYLHISTCMHHCDSVGYACSLISQHTAPQHKMQICIGSHRYFPLFLHHFYPSGFKYKSDTMASPNRTPPSHQLVQHNITKMNQKLMLCMLPILYRSDHDINNIAIL
jgi:hypothetical protein